MTQFDPSRVRATTCIALSAAIVLVVSACSAPAVSPDIPFGAEWLARPVAQVAPAVDGSNTGGHASGPTLDSGTLTLRALVEAAQAANPGLRAAHSRHAAAAARPGQVSLPDPMIEYTYFPERIQTRFGPQNQRVMISQTIPWPGRLAAEASARTHEAEAARLGVEVAARNIVAEITVLYHELVYLDRARKVIEENRKLSHQLAAIADSLQAREEPDAPDAPTIPGRRSVLLVDALKARAQEAQLAFDQVTIAEQRLVAEAKLNRLLGRPPDKALGTPAQLADVRLTADLSQLSTELLSHRQELSMAAKRAEAARARIDVAQLMAVPDLKLGAMWAEIGENPMGGPSGIENDSIGLSVGLNLPIWGDRNQARVDEATCRMDAEVEQGRQMALDALSELTDAYTRYARAERLVQLYRDTLLPQAAEALGQIEALETEDKTTFGEVLEAHMVWLNFTLALVRARSQRFQTIARIEQLLGRPIAPYLELEGAE